MIRKKNKYFFMSFIFLTTGLFLFLYPVYTGWEVEKTQLNMKEDWARVYAKEPLPMLPGDVINEKTKIQTTEKDVSSTFVEANHNNRKLSLQKKLVGKLSISKIALDAIIVPGVDQKSIKHAVGWMDTSSLPDEEGNMVLAGHRSHTYGKFFNRLGEMVEGDTINIQTYSGTHTYIISSIKIVEPTDLSVLKPTIGKKTLTLITCHPLNSNRYRLIVRADQIQ